MKRTFVRVAGLLAVALVTAGQTCSPQGSTQQRSTPQAAQIAQTAQIRQATVCTGNLGFMADLLNLQVTENPQQATAYAAQRGLTLAQLRTEIQTLARGAELYAHWLRQEVGQARADQRIADRLVELNDAYERAGAQRIGSALSSDTERCINEVDRFTV